ncbi:DUF3082 domain-containing protein [Lyngbya confervoides]|uniref:DUF3082 domain-containing protein n=1 Tax=Lyngbya confervoides BDU141951 TaxID=1574623 RepID=A0ABD4T4U2_9CYAN|nr:DUF3082 domain-containing protein [Lyngbya confervoides]MCM1983456.1 DUF3082 domain-containing protein [Lyngbya confervoides BDU141951]
MTEPAPQPPSPQPPNRDLDPPNPAADAPLSPLRPLGGALIAGFLGVLLYRLTQSIALSFATHPSLSSSQFSQNISAAVRTLVVGVSAMATGLFSLAALGLLALTIQIFLQHLGNSKQQS